MVILVVFKTLVFALCWLVEKGSHNGFIMSPVEYPTIMNLYPYVNIYISIRIYLCITYPNYIPTIFPSNPSFIPIVQIRALTNLNKLPSPEEDHPLPSFFCMTEVPEKWCGETRFPFLGPIKQKTPVIRGYVYKLRGITMYNYKL